MTFARLAFCRIRGMTSLSNGVGCFGLPRERLVRTCTASRGVISFWCCSPRDRRIPTPTQSICAFAYCSTNEVHGWILVNPLHVRISSVCASPRLFTLPATCMPWLSADSPPPLIAVHHARLVVRFVNVSTVAKHDAAPEKPRSAHVRAGGDVSREVGLGGGGRLGVGLEEVEGAALRVSGQGLAVGGRPVRPLDV